MFVLVHACASIYICVVARTNLCKNVVLRGCVRLPHSISYFLATRSPQMNVEAASDVDPKYQLNSYFIISVQVYLGMWETCG